MSRRRTFTLVEVLISMTLFTLLLSSLFFWHRHLTVRKGTLEKIKRTVVERHYAWQRLEQIIPKAKPPFFTELGELVFRFDRGLYSDPRLSDTVVGKLYHDPNLNTLCLGIWPDFEIEAVANPSQTLTILDNVSSLSFDFYTPPDPFKLIVDPQQVGKPRPKVGWGNSAWSPYYDALPALVKVIINHEDKEQILHFDLNQPIIYPMEDG